MKDEPLKDERAKLNPPARELAKPDAPLALEPPKERKPPFETPPLRADIPELAKPELRPALK